MDFKDLKWRISDINLMDHGHFITDENISNTCTYTNKFQRCELEIETGKNDKLISQKPQRKCVKHLPLNYPQFSSLTKDQHKVCLKALEIIQKSTCASSFTQEEQKIITTYNNLKWHITKENTLFLKYVKEDWKKIYNFRRRKLMSEFFFTAVEKWIKDLCNVKTYEQHYNIHNMLPLSSNKNTVQVFYKSCLLELGTVARVTLPTINKKIVAPKYVPNLNNAVGAETKVPSSRDSHAEKLARTNDCDIVITESGLKTIVDNYGPNFDTNWIVPVIVKEYDCDGKKKTIAFIDKALPSRTPNLLQLNLKCWKHLLKIDFCKILAHTFETPNISDTESPNHFTNANLNNSGNTGGNNHNNADETDSEDFRETSTSSKRIKIDKEINEEHEEETNSLITNEDNSNESDIHKETLNNCLVSYSDLSLFDDNADKVFVKSKTKNIKKRTFEYHNVSYRKWMLRVKHEKNVMLKEDGEYKEVRILIRSKTDGCEVENESLYKPTTIIPQLEFQANHGAACVTKSDILRQWVSVYFRPLSQLVKVRVNGANKQYMKIERMPINKIVNECLKLYNFSPTVSLEVLYNVLSNLVNLEVGHYVLVHNAKHGPFVALMKSTTKTTNESLDLHNLYSNENCNIDETISWCPIDTTVVMPNHTLRGVMPGMFPPSTYAPRGGFVQNKKNKKKSKPGKNRRGRITDAAYLK